MRRWLRLSLLGLSMLGLSMPGWGAQARAFTVEDLLHLEAVGALAADPTGRWLVIQKMGAYADGPRFDEFGQVGLRSSRLLAVDLTRPEAAAPLFEQTPGVGYIPGPFAPDGRSLLVFRRAGARWDLGVATLATRQVRWLPITPELALYGRTAQWRSDREFVVIARPDGDAPTHLRADADLMANLPKAWAHSAAGETAVTALGSGRFQEPTDRPATNQLLRVDIETGGITALAAGGLFDLELSTSGRFVAALEDLEPLPRSSDGPETGAQPLRRREVIIADLATGAVTHPAKGRDVALHLLSWSPVEDRLLVWSRLPNAPWRSGRLSVTDAETGDSRATATPGLQPVLSVNSEGMTFVSADWLGGSPVVRANPNQMPERRADWYRLTPGGPVNLTSSFKTAPVRIVARAPRALWFEADDGLWGVSPAGHAVRVASGGDLAVIAPTAFAQGQRFQFNNPVAEVDLATSCRNADSLRVRLGAGCGAARDLDLVSPTEQVVLVAPSAVVTRRRDAHGTEQIDVLDRDGRRTTVLQTNTPLREVTFAVPEAVPHPGPGGEALTSWLYLPPEHRAGETLALVVVPYPGDRPDAPPWAGEPGRMVPYSNIQVLAAQGYAVLVPSLPRRPGGEPATDLAAEIATAVDAALARGDLDRHRLAVWGHSFGGYAAMVVATQTDRYRSIIASNGISDLVSAWGMGRPTDWFDPTNGPPAYSSVRWAEGGQGAMAAPPWADPERYRRNSPLLAAEKIVTPLLLITGDQDGVAVQQSREMYAALWRQNKDATLLTYWGENHAVMSPGNIRDMYKRAFTWLDRTLGPPT